MKISLKARLIISYTLLSAFLVISLLLVSQLALEKEFQNYILGNRARQGSDIVDTISEEFSNGRPSRHFLHSLGKTALSEGIILTVHDSYENELLCMSNVESTQCKNMLASMQQTMKNRYPKLEGAYTEEIYPILSGDINYGTVTLGYYGPFYYNDEDIHFIELLDKIFLIAGILFLILAAAVGYFIAVQIAKPINNVIDKARQIERGDYLSRIDIRTKTTEIAALQSSVNSLASTLEMQQQLKKRMANDYAHEFRTPLTTLQSNLEGMIDGIFDASPQRLESLHGEVLRLSRMVSDIDKIVELENDNLVLKKESFDLGKLIEQIAFTFGNEIIAKNIELSSDIEFCTIYADKDKISQVIVNLLSNAVKYTEKNGKIAVKLKNSPASACFSVSDNGIGIAKDDLPHIFEHLYRADTSRARDTGGYGIGLSVVKSIIVAHGGKIEVKSSLGNGCEMLVCLKK